MGKSNIKRCFNSRFEYGYIVEMDYSQLEIMGLAVVTNDPMLKSDLKNGYDLHCINTANLYNEDYDVVLTAYSAGDPYWTGRRKSTKQMSFQLQYGAGATSMAASAGVDIKLAKSFIDAYYNRYPVIKEWQDEMIKEVKQLAFATAFKSPKGYPVKKSKYRTMTGREYTFIERDTPDFLAEKGTMTAFSPTEIKNYPIQGFSTGDFMMFALKDLLNLLLRNDFFGGRLLPVNTIHDSIIFDCSNDIRYGELTEVKIVLEDVHKQMNRYYPELDFDLQPKVDVEIGHDWGSMKDIISLIK